MQVLPAGRAYTRIVGEDILTQRSGKIAITVAIRPTDTNDTSPAIQAIRRARATRPAPIAMPIIGTEGDADRERN